jgi:protein SCO1/2
MMFNIEKRNLFLRVGAGAAVAAFAGTKAIAATSAAIQAQNPREQLRQKRFPNVPLLTHADKEVRFYDDVLEDKKVVINFMYTVCTNICTPVTHNIREAQQLLGDFADDIHFYSISLTPLQDDPASLRNYMKDFQIGKNWTFLTGKPENVERVRQGLGFAQRDAKQDADITNHAGMVRIGNERLGSWGHASAMTTGKSVARMIRFELG